MRHLFVLFAAVIAFQVHAGEIEKLAVVSAMGDTMSVVVYQPSVGSHIDQNRRQTFKLPDDTFDETAVKAASESVRRLSVATPIPVFVLPMDAAARASTTSSGRLHPSTDMQAALQGSGATHLLLFTRHRADSLLKTATGSIGSGHLEGLGFYIDRSKRMRRSDTGESGIGFLAPFAYFRVSLVEVASMAVLKEETVRASTTLSAARLKEGADPWEVLTAEQKVTIIQKLIRTETSRVVPLLLVAN